METFTVTLNHLRTMKNSERYDAVLMTPMQGQGSLVKSLYIGMDAFSDGHPLPDAITVTVKSAS